MASDKATEYRYAFECDPHDWATMTEFHSKNFDDDAVLRYLYNSKPEPQRVEFTHRVIKVLQRMASYQNAVFDQVWTTDTEDPTMVCGITWLRPGTSQDNPRYYIPSGMVSMSLAAGFRGVKRMLYDWEYKDARAKSVGLRRADGSRIKKYYYMAWVSTAVEARGQGLSSEVIRKFQERATREKIPIWTNASSQTAYRVYKKCGFQDVEILRLGKGSVDEKGYKQKGGPGVFLAMIVWMPPEVYSEH